MSEQRIAELEKRIKAALDVLFPEPVPTEIHGLKCSVSNDAVFNLKEVEVDLIEHEIDTATIKRVIKQLKDAQAILEGAHEEMEG